MGNVIDALTFYQSITHIGSPLIRLYLKLRQLKGKEEAARINERFGHASKPRPSGSLWWLHAASVGEAISLRPLIARIHQACPELHLLLTTGTVSSASLLKSSLPDYVTHQYIPIDTQEACNRFLDHWQPELGVFTESELWPNLILASQNHGTKLALVNARMSMRSFTRWRRLEDVARQLLTSFQLIAAQSTEDAARYEQLGAEHVKQLGHLKQDSSDLEVDNATLSSWRDALLGRPCIVAASFHPGEDELIANLHQRLQHEIPHLLTILVPRHPPRAAGMAQSFKALGLKPMLRSEHSDLPTNEMDAYIADTIGELGLWYRLADVVIMGGSFIAHGGQNPLEAIRLQTPVIIGPHVHNFQTIVDELLAAGGIRQTSENELVKEVRSLLTDQTQRDNITASGTNWLNTSPPVAQKLTDALIATAKEAA